MLHTQSMECTQKLHALLILHEGAQPYIYTEWEHRSLVSSPDYLLNTIHYSRVEGATYAICMYARMTRDEVNATTFVAPCIHVYTACDGGDVERCDRSGATTLLTGCFRSVTLAGSVTLR